MIVYALDKTNFLVMFLLCNFEIKLKVVASFFVCVEKQGTVKGEKVD